MGDAVYTSIIVTALTAGGLFVAQQLYLNARLVFLSSVFIETNGVRCWLFQVSNRSGLLSKVFHRESVDALAAYITITGPNGLVKTVAGYWYTRSSNGLQSLAGWEVSIAEGATRFIPFVSKKSGTATCTAWNNTTRPDNRKHNLLEGVYLVSLKLGSGAQSCETFYILNNSGSEFTGFRLKGPMKRKVAIKALENTGWLFPVAAGA